MQTALPRRAGFTLIEVLVVLVIISLFATITTLSLEGLHNRTADDEVARLRRVLEIASERASIQGSPVEVEFLSNSYRFSALDAAGQWRLLFTPATLAEREWPEGMTLESLEVDGVRAALPYQLVFASESPEFRLQLHTPNGTRWLVGHMSGAVTLETAPVQSPMAVKE